MLGAEASLEQQIRANLYAACFFSLVYNSHLRNEYRAGLRLSYLIDDRLRGMLQ